MTENRHRCRALALVCCFLRSKSLTTSPNRYRNSGHRQRQLQSTFTLRAVQTETESILQNSDVAAVAIDKTILSKLDSCNSRTAARKILSHALYPSDDETKRLYDSVRVPKDASTRPISDAELSVQTRTINSKYKILDLIEQNGDRDIDRASLAVLCVFVFGSSSAILAQQATAGLPEILRWVIVFALCFSPLILVGYGLAVPEELSATLVAIQRQLFPAYRKRMIQHEAGHFLIGYLLGWPVKAYQASNAVKNAVEFYPLSDEDVGKDRAKVLGFDVRKSSSDSSTEKKVRAKYVEEKPYYSRDGSGGSDMERSVLRDEDSTEALFALAPKDDPTVTWPFRGFDEETLDKLAIISVAGACSEVLGYGNAEGGVADLLQLRRIYGAAASARRGSNGSGGEGSEALGSFSDDAKERRLRRENENSNGGMDEREMDSRTRFALGYAFGLLRQHLGALDALAEVMERDGSVSECILALEECSNVSGYTLEGDYDKIRREQFLAEQGGLGAWVENTFLGGSKTIDTENSDVIYGKGGGDRKQKFQLTGDDPFYAALAVAVAFAAWASSGGLALH